MDNQRLLFAAMEKRKPLEPWQEEDATRLKTLFNERAGMSQLEFAEKYAFGTQTYVSYLLNGRRPLSLEEAIRFAKALKCEVEDFSPTLAEQIKLAVNSPSFDNNVGDGPALRGKVPVISWVQAGAWMEAVDNFAPGQAEEWIDTEVTVGRHTYALVVKGDSMAPDFPEGMVLVVEPDMSADNGDFVIAKNGDNEATFKQLVMDGGVFYLKPLNTRYPILTVGPDTQIVGVVREALSRRRLK